MINPLIDKQTLKIISDKEMDRKDFLKYTGVVLLSVVGFKAITNILLQVDDEPPYSNTSSTSKSGYGFGGGKYGA